MECDMRRMIHSALVLASVTIVNSTVPPIVQAQQPDATVPAFEVATIKLNNSGDQRQSVRIQPGGRITITNIPARQLILVAYQLQSFQLVGGPSWIATDHFDIIAKLEGNRPAPSLPGTGNAARFEQEPIQLALRTLFADRFKLTLHRETRQMDIYALVLAKPGSGPGVGLKQSTTDCSPAAVAARRAGASQGPPGPPPPGAPFCGLTDTPGQIRMGGFPLSDVTTALGQITGRMVIDRTGLRGNWDFTLTFQPETPSQPPPGVDPSAIDPTVSSIFTALQEELGLKLESTKGPVDVVVIDRIERPTLD
jgi:uncharacterized protein (TIGR03435 family)